jgi:pyridoxal phosphate-dependent aminotransferase EpsN
MRIYLSRPHMSGNEERRVAEAFASNFVAPLGPQLDAFEASVRDYLEADVHCVGLSSGSAALHLALRIAGVGAGDEVWISSMTFAGGIFPVNYLGATPRFFDLDPNSWNIDTARLAEELAKAAAENRLPKAIVPTDLYGQSVDLDALETLAAKYGVRLINDSAESLGATYKNGRKAGTGGDAAILSFNGNKIITTSGGGMLVTKRKTWADEARFLATQARDPAPHYEHSTLATTTACQTSARRLVWGKWRYWTPASPAAAKSSSATKPRSPAPASLSCPNPKACIRHAGSQR